MNGKFYPRDSKVGVPDQMAKYRKTTLVQVDEESPWEVVEDRVHSKAITVFDKTYERCLIFLQEPRA